MYPVAGQWSKAQGELSLSLLAFLSSFSAPHHQPGFSYSDGETLLCYVGNGWKQSSFIVL